jgi:uncharacterized Tic20 family protein
LGPSDIEPRVSHSGNSRGPKFAGDWKGTTPIDQPQGWELKLAMLAHLLGGMGLLGAVVGGVAGPLIVWFLYRKDSVFVEHHAREAVNFQLTIIVITAVCFLLTGLTCGLLLPKMLIPVLLQIVFGLIATFAARSGKLYRYPVCLRLLKEEGINAPFRR